MKFLHISDLHYSPKTDGRTSRELRAALPAALRRYAIRADELLITGDYRYAPLQNGAQAEAEAAEQVAKYILDIAEALHIRDPKTHIHLIPGNHDRARDADPSRGNAIQKAYSSRKGTFSPKDLSFLKGRFPFFDLVCQKLYGKDVSHDSLHFYRRIGNTVLLCMNTAILHNGDGDRGKLLIGNDELALLLDEIQEKYPACPIVVLAHHPPDYFEESEKKVLEDLFRGRPIRLYLCGDAHNAWCRRVNDWVEITMGCIKDEENAQATFLWGDTGANTYTAYLWLEAWVPYTVFNEKLRVLLNRPDAVPQLTDGLIAAEQDRMQNEALLPWMKNSVSHRAVFPRLFIAPRFDSEKLKQPFPYQDLDCCRNKNIAVIGDAGAGKTTLLRYLYLYQNGGHGILYLKASSLCGDSSQLSDYERSVRAILLGTQPANRHYLILLDGIDEACFHEPAALDELVRGFSGNVSLWFGWRSEHFYQRRTPEIDRMLFDVLSLNPWSREQALEYVRSYAEQTRQEEILPALQALSNRGEDLGSLIHSPFQLTLLVYLLENAAHMPELQRYLHSGDRSIYGLYEQFLMCWLEKERERGTSRLPEAAVLQMLQEIAGQLYYHDTFMLSDAAYQDSAVAGLLTFTVWRDRQTATGFYHRSLCAFFCARKIFCAVMSGGAALAEVLRIPLRNDVTDFVRSALGVVPGQDLERIRKHCIQTYWQALRPRRWILPRNTRAIIRQSSEEQRFYLRNELVYLVTRIPDFSHTVPAFLEEAYRREQDPYMKLDIAYGAVLAGPSWIALEYAASLIPGSESDLTNRSWTVAYFGDVQDNPYHYRDTEKRPWSKSREARLRRFQSSKHKSIRFRIMDFPLMYCFYVSRDWADISEADYEILCRADIDCPEYTGKEKAFLREQKSKLLEEYQKRLEAGRTRSRPASPLEISP